MKSFRHGVSGILQVKTLFPRMKSLLKTPVFWLLSFWGNFCIILGAWLFYYFESSVNPPASNFLDCLLWTMGIVTTVGVGAIHPVTTGGKILMMVMMMGGAIFLWSYMALFIGALVEPELKLIESEVSDLQHHAKFPKSKD